jgi:hypothetical protein
MAGNEMPWLYLAPDRHNLAAGAAETARQLIDAHCVTASGR